MRNPLWRYHQSAAANILALVAACCSLALLRSPGTATETTPPPPLLSRPRPMVSFVSGRMWLPWCSHKFQFQEVWVTLQKIWMTRQLKRRLESYLVWLIRYNFRPLFISFWSIGPTTTDGRWTCYVLPFTATLLLVLKVDIFEATSTFILFFPCQMMFP